MIHFVILAAIPSLQPLQSIRRNGQDTARAMELLAPYIRLGKSYEVSFKVMPKEQVWELRNALPVPSEPLVRLSVMPNLKGRNFTLSIGDVPVYDNAKIFANMFNELERNGLLPSGDHFKVDITFDRSPRSKESKSKWNRTEYDALVIYSDDLPGAHVLVMFDRTGHILKIVGGS